MMRLRDGETISGLTYFGNADPAPCDSCGHNMTSNGGVTVVGVSFSFKDIPQECVPRHSVGRDYRACFSCWFEALGIKPNLEAK